MATEVAVNPEHSRPREGVRVWKDDLFKRALKYR